MHEDEESFLNRIAENKADIAPRLVYADWLEERGDSRSDLIRIEEEMRRLPVFSDRFWELKPQRNQLRSQAPAHWLEAMNYTRHAQLIFAHGIPDGWKERWRIIREFTERWHGIPMGDVGGRQAEIAETEARLGRQFPPSLCEYVAFVRDVFGDYRSFGLIREEYTMEEVEGYPALSLLIDIESLAQFVVRYIDLNLIDPPVFIWESNRLRSFGNIYATNLESPTTCETVTLFALRYSRNRIFAEGGSFSTWAKDTSKLIDNLQSYFPIQASIGQATIFEDESFLVWLESRDDMQSVSYTVELIKPLQQSDIPSFLLEYTDIGSFKGVFAENLPPEKFIY